MNCLCFIIISYNCNKILFPLSLLRTGKITKNHTNNIFKAKDILSTFELNLKVQSPSQKYFMSLLSFSAALTSIVGNDEVIDFNRPKVCSAIEPHIEKCRQRRIHFQEQDKIKHGYKSILELNHPSLLPLIQEVDLTYDTTRYPLAEEFATMLGLTSTTLDNLHVVYNGDRGKLKDRGEKRTFMAPITNPISRQKFHSMFIDFVITYIGPHLYKTNKCTQFYFQSFPCIRVVRPNEFSIGPHCDSSYGFNQANINFYIPLTRIYGTNSLVLESSPGQENWHIIDSNYGGIKRFWGAQCSHFTVENHTSQTRISLDFRVVDSRFWIPDHDQFTSSPGYYAMASYSVETDSWCVMGDIGEPDYRVGFPFERSTKPI